MKKILFAVLCVLISRVAMADIVYLTDGTILKGKISEKQADYIVIETEDETLEIQNEDIDHFNYSKKKSKKGKASDPYKFTLWGGYTNFKMDDVNNNINLDAQEGRELGIDISSEEVKNGYVLGLDFGIKMNPNIYIGPRIEYLIPNDGKVDAGIVQIFKYSLFAIMGGGSYEQELNDQFSFIGKLYAGYGFAGTEYKNKIWDYDMGYKGTGSGIIADLSVGTELQINNQSGIGIDLGYRFAKISKMTYSSNYPNWGVKEGDTIKGFYNNDLSVDFSSIFLNFAIFIAF